LAVGTCIPRHLATKRSVGIGIRCFPEEVERLEVNEIVRNLGREAVLSADCVAQKNLGRKVDCDLATAQEQQEVTVVRLYSVSPTFRRCTLG
jgi:hypothetical protein